MQVNYKINDFSAKSPMGMTARPYLGRDPGSRFTAIGNSNHATDREVIWSTESDHSIYAQEGG
jgi:hypothetical protein